ncbi:hypothetical protein LTR66_006748 [Elasticomyces elasticus]|nr:hypothetical protein LTR66_006748 [Elasticomyces elasticus]
MCVSRDLLFQAVISAPLLLYHKNHSATPACISISAIDSSASSSIDDLAARTTVKDYGNIRCMTPPLDEEEENEESRLLEVQARRELEKDGCPPCYPPYLETPLRNPPQEYQTIIKYWQSFPGTGDVVLCAQLSNWRKFRASQLIEFMDEVRERRRRHKVDSNICLLLDPEQQSWLENWMEFQNYHLKRLERFEKKRDKLEKDLDKARDKAENTNTGGSDRAAKDAEAVRQVLENAVRDLERHNILLQWIEQEWRAMDAGYPTPVQRDNDDQGAAAKAVRRTSARYRQKRRPEASMVLGKVRVSKAKPKKWTTKFQKSKAPELEHAIPDSDAIPQSSIPQASKRRDTKPRRTQKEETQLRQILPQRVSKAKRFADARAKSLPETQRCDVWQIRSPDRARCKRQPAPQRPQPAPENVMTRSGRITRPAVRWAPG